VPRACPSCGNLDIAPIGRGTERLHEQLAEHLHGRDGGPVRLIRIDADSTRARGALQTQLAAVHDGDVEVIVGTQMVTKGHDFRRITLVAAVQPDGALFSSDFRAPERLFALLMQAAGRAGRDARQGGTSELWVQTHHPTHPLYRALARHDYASFAADQLAERQAAGWPPHTHLALLRAEARQMADALAFLAAVVEALAQPDEATMSPATREAAGAVQVYPPVPMPLARIADVERAQLLLESHSRPALQHLLTASMPSWVALKAEHRRVVRWSVDVDPISL
jgi:primosomal protein N' (replication factor Y)